MEKSHFISYSRPISPVETVGYDQFHVAERVVSRLNIAGT